MLPRRYFVQSVNYLSLFTDRNETYTNCGACSNIDIFTVSNKNHEYNARCFEEGTLYNQQSALFYWPIGTKLIPLVPHASKVVYLQFKRDHMNRRQDASKKVFCTISNVPFFIDRSQRNVYHSSNVIYLQVQRDPMKRRRDALKKVLCTTSKVPFFIDRSKRNLYLLCRLRRLWYVYSFK
jgi:hypothetical protein